MACSSGMRNGLRLQVGKGKMGISSQEVEWRGHRKWSGGDAGRWYQSRVERRGSWNMASV